MKKIFSVALVLVMVLSSVSVMAFALQDRAVVEITVTPTQTNYQKGDIVTFEVFYEGSEEEVELAGPTIMGFGYDSSVFETLEDVTTVKYLDKITNIFIYEGYKLEDATVSPANSSVVSRTGATDVDSAKGWDKYIMFKINTQDVFQDYSEKAASYAFRLKIKDDANPAGNYTVGISDYVYRTEDININDEYGGIFGDDTEAFGFANPNMFSFVDGTVNVASAAAPSILQYDKAQIRFRGIGATSTSADYEGKFDVRTKAKISEADFLSTFESEANAIAKVSKFGFVYAATSNVAADDFDLETAKAVAQGGKADGYVDKEVTYMQHKAGTDYTFTCLIENIADADKTDGVSCIAYVCYDGEYIYFDAPVTVSYAGLYSQYMPA